MQWISLDFYIFIVFFFFFSCPLDKPDSLKTGADRLCRKKRRRNAKTGQNACAAAWDFLKASSPPPLAEEEFKTFLEKTIAAQSRANPAYGGERLSQRCDEWQDHNPDKGMENRV